jgi:hypothetical protein
MQLMLAAIIAHRNTKESILLFKHFDSICINLSKLKIEIKYPKNCKKQIPILRQQSYSENQIACPPFCYDAWM